jgi:hypothetical protein
MGRAWHTPTRAGRSESAGAHGVQTRPRTGASDESLSRELVSSQASRVSARSGATPAAKTRRPAPRSHPTRSSLSAYTAQDPLYGPGLVRKFGFSEPKTHRSETPDTGHIQNVAQVRSQRLTGSPSEPSSSIASLSRARNTNCWSVSPARAINVRSAPVLRAQCRRCGGRPAGRRG